jgi:hypothetical protein
MTVKSTLAWLVGVAPARVIDVSVVACPALTVCSAKSTLYW